MRRRTVWVAPSRRQGLDLARDFGRPSDAVLDGQDVEQFLGCMAPNWMRFLILKPSSLHPDVVTVIESLREQGAKVIVLKTVGGEGLGRHVYQPE